MTRLFIICLLLTFVVPHCAFGQNGFTLSTPIIYSNVEVQNNWSPPTAVNRQNKFKGKGLGLGAHINYSFRPNFLIRNKHVTINLGIGYFKQRFDIERPFDYESPLQSIFYTDHYSYHCLQGMVGLSYNHAIRPNLSVHGNLSYSLLHSFRQDYTPTTNSGYGHLTQVNHNQMDFGNLLILEIGLNRNLSNRFSIGLNLLIPLYTRWRNDEIFKDDTSTYSHPGFSLGSSISFAYNLK